MSLSGRFANLKNTLSYHVAIKACEEDGYKAFSLYQSAKAANLMNDQTGNLTLKVLQKSKFVPELSAYEILTDAEKEKFADATTYGLAIELIIHSHKNYYPGLIFEKLHNAQKAGLASTQLLAHTLNVVAKNKFPTEDDVRILQLVLTLANKWQLQSDILYQHAFDIVARNENPIGSQLEKMLSQAAAILESIVLKENNAALDLTGLSYGVTYFKLRSYLLKKMEENVDSFQITVIYEDKPNYDWRVERTVLIATLKLLREMKEDVLSYHYGLIKAGRLTLKCKGKKPKNTEEKLASLVETSVLLQSDLSAEATIFIPGRPYHQMRLFKSNVESTQLKATSSSVISPKVGFS